MSFVTVVCERNAYIFEAPNSVTAASVALHKNEYSVRTHYAPYLQELVGSTALDNLAFVHDEDEIALNDGVKAVCDLVQRSKKYKYGNKKKSISMGTRRKV